MHNKSIPVLLTVIAMLLVALVMRSSPSVAVGAEPVGKQVCCHEDVCIGNSSPDMCEAIGGTYLGFIPT